jgi:hypothetical protein
MNIPYINTVNALLQNFDQSNTANLGTLQQQETDFRTERDLNYPFTEIPSFVKTEVEFGPNLIENEIPYLHYVRSCFWEADGFETFLDANFHTMKTLSSEEVDLNGRV